MSFRATNTKIKDVLIIEPTVFADNRGFLFESFNLEKFIEIIGQPSVSFVQDIHSKSSRGVLRGLHYQDQHPQSKLVRVARGKIFDVAVDLRLPSETYGQWVGVELSSENKKQLWIPAGFAHGYLVISEEAEVLYKTTDYYFPEYQKIILWNDPILNIQWPTTEIPILSQRDSMGEAFKVRKKLE